MIIEDFILSFRTNQWEAGVHSMIFLAYNHRMHTRLLKVVAEAPAIGQSKPPG